MLALDLREISSSAWVGNYAADTWWKLYDGYAVEIASRIVVETSGRKRADLRGGNRRKFATDTRWKKQVESAVN